MIEEFEFSEMEPGKHDLQFHCEWAVFPKANPGSSLCYVTSEERAKWISDRLNELLHLRPSPSSAVADDKKVLEEKEAVSDSAGTVLQKCAKCETLEARLERAGGEIRKAVRDWHRFQDFIIAEGQQEYFRLVDAGKKADGVIEKFMGYLASLWNERDMLETLLSSHSNAAGADQVSPASDSPACCADSCAEPAMWECVHGLMYCDRDKQRLGCTFKPLKAAPPVSSVERKAEKDLGLPGGV